MTLQPIHCEFPYSWEQIFPKNFFHCAFSFTSLFQFSCIFTFFLAGCVSLFWLYCGVFSFLRLFCLLSLFFCNPFLYSPCFTVLLNSFYILDLCFLSLVVIPVPHLSMSTYTVKSVFWISYYFIFTINILPRLVKKWIFQNVHTIHLFICLKGTVSWDGFWTI